jgi:hypothetical protein
MRLIDADAYSAEMKDRQEAAWKWRNEAIAEEDEVKLARAEGAYTAFTEAKLTMDKHIINPWRRVEEPPKDGLYGKIVCDTEGQISVCRGYATVKLQNGSVVYTDSRLLDIFKEETDNWNWEDITHFTHWMPMPEPPKEDA